MYSVWLPCEYMWLVHFGRQQIRNSTGLSEAVGLNLCAKPITFTFCFFPSCVTCLLGIPASSFCNGCNFPSKLCSDRAEVKVEATIFFNVCHLIFDLFRFRSHFWLGVNRPLKQHQTSRNVSRKKGSCNVQLKLTKISYRLGIRCLKPQ